MDYKKIRTSAVIFGFGYLFMVVAVFSNLSKIEGLGNANRIIYFLIPGFITLTIGATLVRKQSSFFRASFIAFLSLNFLFILFIVLALVSALVPSTANVLSIVSSIIEAMLTVGLAICNHLLAGAIKDVFTKKGETKMAIYSMIMSFCVNKLALVSTVLPLIKISKISATLITAATLVVDIVFQGSFCVFMFITAFKLKDENKTDNVKANDIADIKVIRYQKIKRSTIILAVGYAFLMVCIFTSLSSIGVKNLSWTSFLSFAAFPGFALLTIGMLLIRKEHKFFAWSFCAFVALDVLILTSIGLNFWIIKGSDFFQKNPAIFEKLNIFLKILSIVTNASLASANGLLAFGIKTLFKKEKNNKAVLIYCTINEFGVSALLLFSSILGAFTFEAGLPTIVSTSVQVGVDFLIQAGYVTFMLIITSFLIKKCKESNLEKVI